MSAITFRPATKTTSKLRLAIAGPSGSGKTFTSLRIATELARVSGHRIAVIDSERGSASKYAHLHAFDVVELEDGDPETYIAAIRAAEAAGYGVLVIDSMSHAWSGKGGVLEQVDGVAARNHGNKFAAWQKGTPLHQSFIDTIVGARMHVIATMRSKTEWVVEENEKGKKQPRKIGTAPVQRDGVEYEFDVMGELDLDHTLVVTKSRCPEVDGKVYRHPGADFAAALNTWLSLGTAPSEAPRLTIVPPTSTAPTPKTASTAEAKAAQAARVESVKLRIDRAKATLGDAHVRTLVGDLKGKRLIEVEQAADQLEQAIRDAAAESAHEAGESGDDAPFDDAPEAPAPAAVPPAAPTETHSAPAVALTPLKAMWAVAQRCAWRSEEVTGLAHRMFAGLGPSQLDEEQLGKLCDAIEDPANAPVRDAAHAHDVLGEARGVESDVRDTDDFAAAAARHAQSAAHRGSPRRR